MEAAPFLTQPHCFVIVTRESGFFCFNYANFAITAYKLIKYLIKYLDVIEKFATVA